MGDGDKLRQAIHFRLRGSYPQLSQTVVAAALVVQCRIGAFVRFLNQTIRKHLLNRTVERAGTDMQLSLCETFDFLHDAVAMQLTITQCKKNVKYRRAE